MKHLEELQSQKFIILSINDPNENDFSSLNKF